MEIQIHKHTKGRFKKPVTVVLTFLFLVALFRSFLANNIPVYAVLEGKTRFPVCERILAGWGLISPTADILNADSWLPAEKIVWPIIRYAPNETDRLNDRFQKPHFMRNDSPQNMPHYLGTDALGHDVASILIHGTGISFFIGVVSMLMASIIGILLGAFAGFWGDSRLKKNILSILWMLIGAFVIWFYGFQTQITSLSEGINQGGIHFLKATGLSLVIVAFLFLFFYHTELWINRYFKGKKYALGVDFSINRIIELMVVIPKIILILAIAALAKPSVLLPTLLIGLTSWPSIARFTRAEMLHVRNSDYMAAAETYGLSSFRLFFRHALPNSLSPLPSLIAFGIAGAILAESSLSFLGIGMPPEVLTWGKLLAQGRSNPSAWWVTILPGFMIFLIIFCFHRLGEIWQKKKFPDKKLMDYFR